MMTLCFFLCLAGTIPNCNSLAINQQKLLTNLFQDLAIKNFLILRKDFSDLKINDLKLMKEFTELNIYTDFVTLNETRDNFENKTWKYEPKTFILFDDDEIFDEMANIFNEGYDKFIRLAVWGMFQTSEFNIENLEKEIYIPYDCQFFVIKDENEKFEIFEYYDAKIHQRNFYTTKFGDWDEVNSLIVPETDFYQRRLDLNQTIMEVAYVKREVDFCQRPDKCAIREIKDDMARIMNFKPETVLIKDEEERLLLFLSWFIRDDFWEINTDINYVEAENYPKEVIGPLWKVPAYCYIKYLKSYEEGVSFSQARPFSSGVWIAVLIWIVISSICVIYIDYRSAVNVTKEKFVFTESLFRQFEVITNQCGGAIPKSYSSRIVTIITLSLSITVMSFYSAVVLSFLYVRIITPPFENFQELLENEYFKAGYLLDWFFRGLFSNWDDIVTKITNEKWAARILPLDFNDSVHTICEDSKYAFFTFNSSQFDKVNANLNLCKILRIPKPMLYVWAVAKARENSCYRKIFNRILKSFRSAGILQKMQKLGVATSTKILLNEDDFEPVEYDTLNLLFIVVGTLYLVALIIFLMEIIWSLFRKIIKKKNELENMLYNNSLKEIFEKLF